MIYFILSPEANSVKIGYTKENAKKRLMELQTGNNTFLTLIALIEGNFNKEKELHQEFIEYRQSGEWFYFGEKIRTLVTNINNQEKTTPITTAKKDLVEEILCYINDNATYVNIKKDKVGNFYTCGVDGTYTLFDYDNFIKEFYEYSSKIVTKNKLKSILFLCAKETDETLIEPSFKSDEISFYVAYKIENKIPFRLKDIISDLKINYDTKFLSSILINEYNLKKPTKHRSYKNIKGYWWNYN